MRGDRGAGQFGRSFGRLVSGASGGMPGSPGGLNRGMAVGSLSIGGTPKLHFGDYVSVQQDPSMSPGGWTFGRGLGRMGVKRLGGF